MRHEGQPENLVPTTEDPLAAFDGVLAAVTEEKEREKEVQREKKMRPKRQAKERSTEMMQTAEKMAVSFQRLAREGSYDELAGIPFEAIIPPLAAGLQRELPPAMDASRQTLAGIADRLKKFHSLSAEMQAEAKIAAAAKSLHHTGEVIMREWAAAAQEMLTELQERQRLAAEAADSEIRDIVESPLFTAEVEPVNESYEDYKKRATTAVVEHASQEMRHEVLEVSLDKVLRGMKNGAFFSDIAGKLLSGQASLSEIKTQLPLFSGELNAAKNEGSRLDEKKLQELYEKHFGPINWSHAQQQPIGTDLRDYLRPGHTDTIKHMAAAAEKALPLFENAIENTTLAGAAIETVAEEKMSRIVKIIEEELPGEEERRSALEYVKQYFPTLEAKFNILGPAVAITLKLPDRDEQTPPSWLLQAYQEYNGMELFKRLTLGSGGERRRLMIDQVLRAHQGEAAFGGEQLRVDAGRQGAQHGDAVLRAFLPEGTNPINYYFYGDTVSRLTLDQQLLTRATATTELLKKNEFYNDTSEKYLTDMRLVLAQTCAEAPFNKETGEPHAYKHGQAAAARRWQEDLARRTQRERPTSRQKIERVIADHDGRYPVATVTDAVALIDALKSQTLGALRLAQEAKKTGEAGQESGRKELMDAQENIKKLTAEVADLKQKLEGKTKELTVQAKEADEFRQAAQTAENTVRQRRREIKNTQDNLANLLVFINNETKRIAEIKGWGKEENKRIAFDQLVASIAEEIGLLTPGKKE